MKKKVCIDARAIKTNMDGISRYVVENLKKLIQYKEYEFLLISNKKIPFDIKPYSNITLIEDLVYSKLPGSLWYVLRANSFVKKYKCDIFWGPQHVLPYFKVKGVKYIVTFQDVVNKIFPETMSTYNMIISKLLYKRALINADHIITISKTTKKDLLRYYPFVNKEDISPIYLGKSTNNDDTSFCKNDVGDYIFMLGSVEPRKNIISMLKVFEYLKQNNKTLKLVVSGGGGWKNQNIFDFLEKSQFKEDIIFTGFVSDLEIVSYMKNSKVFVFPSLYEGFGLPLIEAESFCPAIANDIEIFQELGLGLENINFCDFTNANPQDTARCIESILAKDIGKLKFKKGYEEIFSWEYCSKLILEIFEK